MSRLFTPLRILLLYPQLPVLVVHVADVEADLELLFSDRILAGHRECEVDLVA